MLGITSLKQNVVVFRGLPVGPAIRAAQQHSEHDGDVWCVVEFGGDLYVVRELVATELSLRHGLILYSSDEVVPEVDPVAAQVAPSAPASRARKISIERDHGVSRPDFTVEVEDGGEHVIFRPHTKVARQWITLHILDALIWYRDGGFMLTAQTAGEVALAMRQSGLTVA